MFGEAFQRQQSLRNHFRERERRSGRGIPEEQRNRFRGVADAVPTFFDEPWREIRRGRRPLPETLRAHGARQRAAGQELQCPRSVGGRRLTEIFLQCGDLFVRAGRPVEFAIERRETFH